MHHEDNERRIRRALAEGRLAQERERFDYQENQKGRVTMNTITDQIDGSHATVEQAAEKALQEDHGVRQCPQWEIRRSASQQPFAAFLVFNDCTFDLSCEVKMDCREGGFDLYIWRRSDLIGKKFSFKSLLEAQAAALPLAEQSLLKWQAFVEAALPAVRAAIATERDK